MSQDTAWVGMAINTSGLLCIQAGMNSWSLRTQKPFTIAQDFTPSLLDPVLNSTDSRTSEQAIDPSLLFGCLKRNLQKERGDNDQVYGWWNSMLPCVPCVKWHSVQYGNNTCSAVALMVYANHRSWMGADEPGFGNAASGGPHVSFSEMCN